MKILILDDDLNRLKEFRQSLIGHSIVAVTTEKECIDKLQNEAPFDIIYLDHDLYGKVYVPSGPGTGFEVAEWLQKNPSKKPNKIIIHTLNKNGAENMLRILPEAEYTPAAWIVPF